MKRVGRTPPLYFLNRAASIVGLDSTCDISVLRQIDCIAYCGHGGRSRDESRSRSKVTGPVPYFTSFSKIDKILFWGLLDWRFQASNHAWMLANGHWKIIAVYRLMFRLSLQITGCRSSSPYLYHLTQDLFIYRATVVCSSDAYAILSTFTMETIELMRHAFTKGLMIVIVSCFRSQSPDQDCDWVPRFLPGRVVCDLRFLQHFAVSKRMSWSSRTSREMKGS